MVTVQRMRGLGGGAADSVSFGIKHTWFKILSVPFTRHVNLDKLLNFLNPQFCHLKKGTKIGFLKISKFLWGLNETMHVKWLVDYLTDSKPSINDSSYYCSKTWAWADWVLIFVSFSNKGSFPPPSWWLCFRPGCSSGNIPQVVSHDGVEPYLWGVSMRAWLTVLGFS